MMLRGLLVMIATLAWTAGCGPAVSQHEARFGTVHVAFAGGWTPHQLDVLRGRLDSMGALGPAFVEVAPDDPYLAQLRLESGAGLGADCLALTSDFSHASIQGACLGDDRLLALAFAHAAAHAIGLTHVADPAAVLAAPTAVTIDDVGVVHEDGFDPRNGPDYTPADLAAFAAWWNSFGH